MAKKKRKMKLQWRRFKYGTIGVIIVAIVGILLLWIGILSIVSSFYVGILFISASVALFFGVGYDLYRMYGY